MTTITQKKGPASAPTLPDHGSNPTSPKGSDMNSESDTTRDTAAARSPFLMDVPAKTVGAFDHMDKGLDALRTISAGLQAGRPVIDQTTLSGIACTLLDAIDDIYAARVHLQDQLGDV